MLDELLTLCTGIPRLAETTASIGYNRAALLRIQGRFADADDGYRTRGSSPVSVMRCALSWLLRPL